MKGRTSDMQVMELFSIGRWRLACAQVVSSYEIPKQMREFMKHDYQFIWPFVLYNASSPSIKNLRVQVVQCSLLKFNFSSNT